jgi:hypothetical protein
MVDTRFPPGETAGMKGLATWSETRTLMRSSLLRITSKDCPFTDGYSGCSDCEVQQGIHEVATLDPNITTDLRLARMPFAGRLDVSLVWEQSTNDDSTNSTLRNMPLPSLVRLSDENRCLPASRTTRQPNRFHVPRPPLALNKHYLCHRLLLPSAPNLSSRTSFDKRAQPDDQRLTSPSSVPYISVPMLSSLPTLRT